MKRLLSIVTALLVATLFVLPASAIINLDGSESEWDGDPGIRPAMETIDGIEPYVSLSEEDGVVLMDGDSVIAADELPEDELPQDDAPEIDRSHLARGLDAITAPAIPFGAALALFIGQGLVSLAALALAIAATIKASRKKQSN